MANNACLSIWPCSLHRHLRQSLFSEQREFRCRRTQTLWRTIFFSSQQHFDSRSVRAKLAGFKSGYLVTSVITCHWHLEQGEGIRITQRVHYEWIMHWATSSDMQQSECQNSLERTFFSSCSRRSHWNKDTRNPIVCSFLHYGSHQGREAPTPDIHDIVESVWQQLAHRRSEEEVQKHTAVERQWNVVDELSVCHIPNKQILKQSVHCSRSTLKVSIIHKHLNKKENQMKHNFKRRRLDLSLFTFILPTSRTPKQLTSWRSLSITWNPTNMNTCW